MKWRSILGGILLMVAGGALALATEHMILLHHGMHFSHKQPSTSDQILATLDDVLSLTPAQHDSIERVLQRHHTSIDSAWKAIHQQLGTQMDSVHKEIGRILTQEQSDRFKAWLQGQQLHHM